MEREPVIGIDLGTTNSVVATFQNGQATVLKNRAGGNLTPSVVAIAGNGKRLVGAIAKRQAVTNAENTAYAVKRLIGRKWSSGPIQQARQILPYPLQEGEHDDVKVVLQGKGYSPSEAAAMVLAELKAGAEAALGRSVKHAVITVPAYFNDGQRQATKDAGTIAGLEVMRIINEPTAAALAYGFGKEVEGAIAVFDLGGGTFDVSILRLSGGVFEVLATGGDTYLGGEDFDNRIIEHLASRFAAENGADLRKDKMALQRLKEAAEKAKCELSTTRETQISLPFVYTPAGGGAALHLQASLSRARLEELTRDLVDRCIEHTRATMAQAGLAPKDIKEVVLVGGMTRMPAVAEAVKRHFGREPCKGVHPDEVVALGAAIQANTLMDEQSDVVLLDVTPHSLGLGIVGGYTRTIIPKNTTVPTSATEMFVTSSDNQTTVKIVVLQGESEQAKENELLGEFMLTGLRPALRGEVQVAVTFDISADGIVSVSAKDSATGQHQSIVVTASGGLTPEELSRVMDEQRDYLLEAQAEEEGRRKRAEIEGLLGEIDELLPKVKGLVASGALNAEVLSKVERAVGAARTVSQGRDVAAMLDSAGEISKTLLALRGVVTRLSGGQP